MAALKLEILVEPDVFEIVTKFQRSKPCFIGCLILCNNDKHTYFSKCCNKKSFVLMFHFLSFNNSKQTSTTVISKTTFSNHITNTKQCNKRRDRGQHNIYLLISILLRLSLELVAQQPYYVMCLQMSRKLNFVC